jgi:uncharacterized protein (DUF2147 family)
MKKRSMGAAWALTLALSPLCGHAQQAPMQAAAQAGRWVTESGNLEVDIAPCDDVWCGTVNRVLANRSMSAPGQTMDAADKRSALGMKILTDLRLADDGTLSGQIYNRENAKTYSVRLTMDGPQQMLVRPYIGLPLFGKTQLWHRASATRPEAKP